MKKGFLVLRGKKAKVELIFLQICKFILSILSETFGYM